MTKILHFIESINEWVGRTCSFAIVILTGLTVLEVILRKFFNSPTTWGFEVAIMFYGLHFMVNSGYTLLHRSHVSIDILTVRLSPRRKAIFGIVGYVVFVFPFLGAVLYQGAKYATQAWAIHELSWSVFGAPVYLYKTLIPVFAFLVLIQAVVIFVQNLFSLIREERYVTYEP
jgi:TRAP-type mannitol/chloroaromatic compound transport system permease small subunit